MPLFEVAIVSVPPIAEVEQGVATEKLVYGPTAVIAADETAAAVKAAINANAANPPGAPGIDMDTAQVLVRRFTDK